MAHTSGATRTVVTIFENRLDIGKREHTCDWESLCSYLIEQPERPDKLSAPLFSLSQFGDHRESPRGALRNKSNLIAIHGVEADYDAMVMSPEEAIQRCQQAGLQALVYTSASHTPETPRWRVVALTSTSLHPSTRRELVGKLNTIFGGTLAGESFTPSQSYFFGRVKGAPYAAYHSTGAYIDQIAVAPTCPPDSPSANGDFHLSDGPDDDWSGPTDDAVLIDRAMKSRKSAAQAFGNKATFAQLWEADLGVLRLAFPTDTKGKEYNASDADYSLAAKLAFWTGRDGNRIERIMRQSALVRPKWDSGNYLARTIAKGCAAVTDVLNDKSPAGEVPPDQLRRYVEKALQLAAGIGAGMKPHLVHGALAKVLSDAKAFKEADKRTKGASALEDTLKTSLADFGEELVTFGSSPQGIPLVQSLAALCAANGVWHEARQNALCAAVIRAMTGVMSDDVAQKLAALFPAGAPPTPFPSEWEIAGPPICTNSTAKLLESLYSFIATHPDIYSYNKTLVRFGTSNGKGSSKAIVEFDNTSFAAFTDHEAWVHKVVINDDGQEVEVRDAINLLDSGKCVTGGSGLVGVKRLERLAERPFIASNGEAVTIAGYDESSHTIYSPLPNFADLKVSSSPTRDEAASAYHSLKTVISQFTWREEGDIANYLGVLLGTVARQFIARDTSGVVAMPGLMISADEKRSGKSLLSRLIFEMCGGMKLTLPEDNSTETFQKAFEAVLTSNSGDVILMNNATSNSSIGGSLLADAIGEPDIAMRVMRTHEVRNVRNRFTFILNGNGIQLTDDLTERFIVTHLRSPTEAERAIPKTAGNLAEELNKPSFCSDALSLALTVVRGWVCAGAPLRQFDEKEIRGTFHQWAKHVGGILEFVGQRDFLSNWGDAAAADEMTPAAVASRDFVHAMVVKFGVDAPFKAADLMAAALAGRQPAFAENLETPEQRIHRTQPARRDTTIPRNVLDWGKVLSKLKGPHVLFPPLGGRMKVNLETCGQKAGNMYWKLHLVEVLNDA